MSGGDPPVGNLSVSCVVEDDTAVLVLEGELDLDGAPEMDRWLRQAADVIPDPRRLVVDLGRLAFIDSTGLRLLLQANARAQEQGYEFVLRPGEPSVQRVFEVTGAIDVLRFEDRPAG
ncbi:MAG TPA: STAS domain-containing protein [Solirubrobacteraceae bacterium]